MPSGASDWDRFFVRLLRAALVAVYATRSGLCRLVEWAETLTILANDPRRSRGSARRTVRTALSTPISKVARHSSSSSRSKGPIPTSTGPAVLTRTSKASHRSPRRSMAESTSIRFVKSAAKGMLSGLPSERIVATVSSRSSLARASTATRAPSRANVSAAARPMPREPPTTSTRASASPRSIPLLLFPGPCAPQSLERLANPVGGRSTQADGNESRDSSDRSRLRHGRGRREVRGTGDIWVADGYGSNLVYCFDQHGNHRLTLTGEEGADGSCVHTPCSSIGAAARHRRCTSLTARTSASRSTTCKAVTCALSERIS